jgi:hypothetical protein
MHPSNTTLARSRQLAEARDRSLEDECARRNIALKRVSAAERAGPCPICGGTDRFSINIRRQLFNCRGCGAGGNNAIAFVMWLDGVGFNAAVETLIGKSNSQRDHTAQPSDPPPTKAKAADHERKQHEKASWLWSQRRPIRGTIAEKYLRSRGIACPLPPTLAFLPARKSGQHPAMIAAFALPNEIDPGVLGDPQNVEAVHLTLLRSDGSGKAEVEHAKRFIGSPGCLPIVISPFNDALGIAITEGIEDALSAFQATGLAVWAAGSAGRMPAMAEVMPDYVDVATICSHDDEAGQNGALKLTNLLHRRGVEVLIDGDRS